MSQIAISLVPGNLPPNPCYATEQARFNDYVKNIQSSLPINFTTVIVSASAPGPDDRDKIWLQVDGNGRILGLNTFANGQWETLLPSAPYLVTGEIRIYDPGLYTPVAPWFACNGTVPGVPNLQGTFIVGAGQRTLTTAQIAAGDTATSFTSGVVGGAEQNFLTDIQQVPSHSHPPLGSAQSFICATPGGSIVAAAGGGVAQQVSTGSAGGVGNPPAGISTTNPFKVLVPYYPANFMQWRPDLV